MFFIFGAHYGYSDRPGFWIWEAGHEEAFLFTTDGGVWLVPLGSYTDRTAAEADLVRVKGVAQTLEQAAEILGVPFRKAP